MGEKVQSRRRTTFKLKKNEGRNKVISLEESIRNHIEPGMSLHFREGSGAAAREVLRQFWGRSPKLTLITSLLSTYGICMIHGNLLSKVIITLCA
jgi:hypothetical protein